MAASPSSPCYNKTKKTKRRCHHLLQSKKKKRGPQQRCLLLLPTTKQRTIGGPLWQLISVPLLMSIAS